jgi:signal transduction histidine kinase
MITAQIIRRNTAGASVLVILAVGLGHVLPSHFLFLPAMLALGVCVLSFQRMSAIIAQERQEKCELDEQLIQSQKLAAIGELSSGIAHEINNPLAVISQEAEWMTHLMNQPPLKGLEGLEEIQDSLSQIEKQVDRCRTITHKLLNFARRMDPVYQEEDLAALVADMSILVEREAQSRGVTLTREFPADLPRVCTDAPLLRQVILNLMTNALQAVKQGGRITVTASRREPNLVDIRVADDGVGIPRENLSKIFNPFFTTKEPGQGTGLGLSMCHAIVDRLGGRIGVESEPGQGTAFTVTLPVQTSGR